jgi:pimeloyl-ACP methyl ester carboxylesterase
MVETTVDLLEEVAATATAIVLIGHSMGGRIAGTVASLRPDLVAGAVLEDPAWISIEVAPTTIDDFTAKERERWADERAIRLAEARASGWPESELDEWLRAKLTLDPRFGARGQIASPLPWQAEVRALAVPTLIVTGDRDVVLHESMLGEVRSLMPVQTQIAVVPNAGHGVRRENPTGYHAVVDAFLERVI